MASGMPDEWRCFINRSAPGIKMLSRGGLHSSKRRSHSIAVIGNPKSSTMIWAVSRKGTPLTFQLKSKVLAETLANGFIGSIISSFSVQNEAVQVEDDVPCPVDALMNKVTIKKRKKIAKSSAHENRGGPSRRVLEAFRTDEKGLRVGFASRHLLILGRDDRVAEKIEKVRVVGRLQVKVDPFGAGGDGDRHATPVKVADQAVGAGHQRNGRLGELASALLGHQRDEFRRGKWKGVLGDEELGVLNCRDAAQLDCQSVAKTADDCRVGRLVAGLRVEQQAVHVEDHMADRLLALILAGHF
ncbi:hypothetical protein TYRP_021416 [Tyrophagus putrescentiae]|nr:hypothetical protein TYRP_021416 [Tyrophagus putrescentiae]